MTTLTGTRWSISEIAGAAILGGEDAMREAHLTLDAEVSRFAACAGCNNIMGSYAQSGDSLTFGMAAMTMMMCPDAVMVQEKAFTEGLAATRTYAIDGDTLFLLDDAGRAVVRARDAEAPA